MFSRNIRRAVTACLLGSAGIAFILPTAKAADRAQDPVGQLAVYRWGAPKGPKQVDVFGQWIHRPNVWAEEFESNESWDSVAGPSWQLGPWQQWVKANPQRRLILSVTMLPGPRDGSGPLKGMNAHQPVSLQAGARGDYNAYFKTLAEQLVARNLDQAILRIGWEFNGGWYTWRGADDPDAWAKYYRQIVTTMRAVPGADKLQFCWNPAIGDLQFPAEKAYPGDEYVDVIGADVYDQSWLAGTYHIPDNATPEDRLARQKLAWDKWTYGGNHGFKFWIDFARSHSKPLAICEWGLCVRTDGHGGGDDPFFVQQMHDVIADPANHVQFNCYFDVQAGDGHHQLSPRAGDSNKPEFPESADLFLKVFGG